MIITIRIEEPRPLEIRGDWETVRTVADFLLSSLHSPLRLQADPQTKEETQKQHRPFPFVPPPGERIKDYAVKAFERLERSRATPEELIEVMQEIGWQSKANHQVEVVRASLRDAKDLFRNRGKGVWEYIGNGSSPRSKAAGVLPLEETIRPAPTETDSARVP